MSKLRGGDSFRFTIDHLQSTTQLVYKNSAITCQTKRLDDIDGETSFCYIGMDTKNVPCNTSGVEGDIFVASTLRRVNAFSYDHTCWQEYLNH